MNAAQCAFWNVGAEQCFEDLSLSVQRWFGSVDMAMTNDISP